MGASKYRLLGSLSVPSSEAHKPSAVVRRISDAFLRVEALEVQVELIEMSPRMYTFLDRAREKFARFENTGECLMFWGAFVVLNSELDSTIILTSAEPSWQGGRRRLQMRVDVAPMLN